MVNAALSSIEAFRYSKAQYLALTSSMVCLARRVMAGSAARRGVQEQVRTTTNKEVPRFWRLAPCDVEARVRRLKWAARWMADLRELELFDGRRVVQRMGSDVRALFFWIANRQQISLPWTSRHCTFNHWQVPGCCGTPHEAF